MRVSYTNVVSGARESIYLSLEQLENKKRVEEIENEIEKLYRQFNPEEPKEPAAILNQLVNTQSFTKEALNHIFRGVVNEKGELKGCHYEGVRGDTARIIPGSKTAPDKNGVYYGKVMKEHQGKILVKAQESSFFPRNWSPQQVLNEINHSYSKAIPVNPYRPTILEGVSLSGVTIRIIVHKNTGKIKNAFPIKGK